MTLRLRRIIYISLIILFTVSAPVIILYTAGYRWNAKKFSLEKTGLIFISTAPAKTDIYVNGQLRAKTSPALVKNLLPDTYDVRIEAGGYLPWQKKLEVRSQLTTFVNKLTLLKDRLPTLIIAGKIDTLALAPDKTVLAFFDRGKTLKLNIADLAGGSVETIFETKPDRLSLSWSPDASWLLLAKDKQILKIFQKSTGFKPAGLGNLPAGKYFWSAKNKNILNIVSGGALYSFNLVSGRLGSPITLPRGSDYLLLNDKLWFVSGETLKFWDPETAGAVIENVATVDFPNASFTGSEGSFFGVSNNFKGLIINADEKRVIAATAPIKKISAAAVSDRLIISNDFEIWLVGKESGGRELITRQAAPILSASWHQGGEYIIFAAAGGIEAIELDSREPRNRYQFLSGKTIGSPLVNDAATFYFSGKINDKEEGLFKLEI